jgi:His/Glu/Gln/Arg/opine family amino acid ABC transporter permease subunit
MDLDLNFILRLIPALLEGSVTTIQLAVASFAIVLVWGLVVALVQQRGGIAGAICHGYVEFVRNTPMLILLYLAYFGLPMVGIMLSEFGCGLLVLSFQNGGYVAEIYRGGLQSVNRNQYEAGRALGMSTTTLYRTVILPQTLIRVIPPMTNQATVTIKDTAQVSVIALMEMTKTGQVWLERSGNPYDVFVTVAILYLVFTTIAGALGKMLERRWKFSQ